MDVADLQLTFWLSCISPKPRRRFCYGTDITTLEGLGLSGKYVLERHLKNVCNLGN